MNEPSEARARSRIPGYSWSSWERSHPPGLVQRERWDLATTPKTFPVVQPSPTLETRVCTTSCSSGSSLEFGIWVGVPTIIIHPQRMNCSISLHIFLLLRWKYGNGRQMWPLAKLISGTSLVVQGLRLSTFHCRGLGSIPGLGTKILHAIHCDQKRKENKKQQQKTDLRQNKKCLKQIKSLSKSLNFSESSCPQLM